MKTNSAALRPFKGRDAMYRSLTTFRSVPDWTSTIMASPRTLTRSATEPTARTILTLAGRFTSKFIPVSLWVENPGADTLRSYWPGGISVNRNSPREFVRVLLVNCVSTFLTVSDALGTIALVGSVMVPDKEAVVRLWSASSRVRAPVCTRAPGAWRPKTHARPRAKTEKTEFIGRFSVLSNGNQLVAGTVFRGFLIL